jgi:FkbM family methyltransferase
LHKKLCKKIYGYEPDEELYNKAKYNIGLNDKSISDKIEIFNIACSNKDKEELYVMGPTESSGLKKKRGEITDETRMVKVKCVDSAKTLGAIIDEYYNKYEIIVKCDCEGAEYEIFDRLEKTDYFRKIDVFIMEWHCDRRDEIEQIFSRNRYMYYIFTTPGRTFGKCYAFKEIGG